MPILFMPLVISFLLTALATFLAIPLMKKYGFVDNPKTHKHPAILHKTIIPRGGGIPIFLGILLTSIFFIPLTKMVVALFIAAFLSALTGLLDDKYDISRYLRLVINVICAIIVVSSGVTFPFITNPLGGILHLDTISFGLFGLVVHLSDLLAVLWIVWVMNMLNWSKGVDGQMPGVVAISAIIIGILSLRFPLSQQATVIASHLSFIIAGAALGFLVWNFSPAKIFPGYGATGMYLLLAAVSLISTAKLATAILVMGVPMIDGLFTVVRRILSGKSPFWHDKKHLHHVLLRLGLGQRQIALFYWIVSAILGTISLTLSSKGKLFAMIMLVILVGGGLLFLHIVVDKNREE